MKLSQALACLALATQLNAAAVPEAKDTLHILPIDNRSPDAAALVSPDHTLEKRKGGGGRGSSSGGSSSSGSSSGGRTSGSSSSGRTSGSSAVGGATSAGSGPARGFGGGKYYGGGAAVPYRSGGRTPNGLLAGALIAPILLLSIMPGLWLYNAYPYHYNNPYRFYNQSADNNDNNDRRSLATRQTTGRNETLPVMCLCEDFAVCGCDENSDQSYINDLIGNGSYAALNKTLVTVSDVNGTKTLILNGTLPNGTTAPGGTDDAEAGAMHLAAGKYTGYWAMGLVVLYGVMM